MRNPSADSVDAPVARVEAIGSRRLDGDVLQVAPRQSGIGGQREGADARGEGCTRRRSRMRVGARVVQIGRHRKEK